MKTLHIATDIGNSRFKLGRITQTGEILGVSAFSYQNLDAAAFHAWLPENTQACWWVSSVQHAQAERFLAWLHRERPADESMMLDYTRIPVKTDVLYPELVGVDRLLSAAAVNTLRSPQRGAVIIDLGTALTVDLVDKHGVFHGGAISPGIGMAASALHEHTSALPLVDVTVLECPEPLGRETESAIKAGIYWGTVGTVRELYTRMACSQASTPELYMTGAAAHAVSQGLGMACHVVENLVMLGICECLKTANIIP